MGYYTRYELNFDYGYDEEKRTKIFNRIGELSGYTYLFDDDVKWYDHEKDMLKLSKEYPDIVFTLNGEGEEAGDIWVAYFKDGKMVRHTAVIKLPEYNPSDLK